MSVYTRTYEFTHAHRAEPDARGEPSVHIYAAGILSHSYNTPYVLNESADVHQLFAVFFLSSVMRALY